MAEHVGIGGEKGVLFFENREGDKRYNIKREYWKDRPFGLSAMLRVRDEAEWLDLSIESIIDWHDEVLIILQGEQSDGSDKIAAQWELKAPHKVRVVTYPWIVPQDEDKNYAATYGHMQDSLHERSYYKNWCMSQTKFSHMHKWDGDMVAHDWLGPLIRELMDRGHDAVRYAGTNLVGAQLRHIGRNPTAVAETRVNRVTQFTYFRPGRGTQQFVGEHRPHVVKEHAYLHFKWAKDFTCKEDYAAISIAWPPNWESLPKYQALIERGIPRSVYRGSYPKLLLERFPRLKDQYVERGISTMMIKVRAKKECFAGGRLQAPGDEFAIEEKRFNPQKHERISTEKADDPKPVEPKPDDPKPDDPKVPSDEEEPKKSTRKRTSRKTSSRSRRK